MSATKSPTTSGKSGFIKADGAKLYYTVEGDGPALVLIHAGIADSRMWADQLPALAQDYRVVRYDVRGCGQSPSPDEDYYDHDDLYEVLEALGIEQAVLVGASNGGRIAVDCALTYPNMVRGLVLVATGLSGHEPAAEIQQGWEAEDAAYEAGGIYPAAEQALRMWVDGPRRRPDDVDLFVRERVRKMLIATYEMVDAGEQAEAGELEPPALSRLAEIEAPTLTIVGELDFADIRALSDQIAARVPNARQVVMTGVAHLPNMERPAEFNRIVLDFLAKIA